MMYVYQGKIGYHNGKRNIVWGIIPLGYEDQVVDEISTDREVVEKLVEDLNRYEVSIFHFHDVIKDRIFEMKSGTTSR